MINYKLIFFIFFIISLFGVFHPRTARMTCAAVETNPAFEGVPEFRQSLFLDPVYWCAKEAPTRSTRCY